MTILNNEKALVEFQSPEGQPTADSCPKMTSPVKMWVPGKLANAHGGSAPSLVEVQ
jgi:hypothetical protein